MIVKSVTWQWIFAVVLVLFGFLLSACEDDPATANTTHNYLLLNSSAGPIAVDPDKPDSYVNITIDSEANLIAVQPAADIYNENPYQGAQRYALLKGNRNLYVLDLDVHSGLSPQQVSSEANAASICEGHMWTSNIDTLASAADIIFTYTLPGEDGICGWDELTQTSGYEDNVSQEIHLAMSANVNPREPAKRNRLQSPFDSDDYFYGTEIKFYQLSNTGVTTTEEWYKLGRLAVVNSELFWYPLEGDLPPISLLSEVSQIRLSYLGINNFSFIDIDQKLYLFDPSVARLVGPLYSYVETDPEQAKVVNTGVRRIPKTEPPYTQPPKFDYFIFDSGVLVKLVIQDNLKFHITEFVTGIDLTDNPRIAEYSATYIVVQYSTGADRKFMRISRDNGNGENIAPAGYDEFLGFSVALGLEVAYLRYVFYDSNLHGLLIQDALGTVYADLKGTWPLYPDYFGATMLVSRITDNLDEYRIELLNLGNGQRINQFGTIMGLPTRGEYRYLGESYFALSLGDQLYISDSRDPQNLLQPRLSQVSGKQVPSADYNYASSSVVIPLVPSVYPQPN